MIKAPVFCKRLLKVGAFFCLHAIAAESAAFFSDFLIYDDNAPALIRLSETNPDAFAPLSEKSLNEIFDYLFLKQQRSEIRTWALNLYKGNSCLGAHAKFCAYLEGLWAGPLLNTYFYDASLVQINRARELLLSEYKNSKQKKDFCTESAAILTELEAKEGQIVPILELQGKVFECLGDEGARIEVYQRLKVLRNIQSALGT